ncbi:MULTISPECIES: hypothetical protein [Paenarthrobacter]|uniref:hypothetical protein n=1 Tax=Paenarthrobacter TaxID=1742992 RepID=UPI0009ABDDB7|nr:MULTISPECIES: hypothetical protein [Paenarthrobacter]BCW13000.1 hypothetical protein NtRootA2_42820 [Arthrobacter sp. NtRootA2]BCW17275.1 hypothetical protein NtRootA4_42540 [Arthrobacter sp. NtRootA4]BCW25383.1 hypothetical protein NtRootC7_42500 [Arthrobacter sp. NtRootC7]BCW29585.1 hypothetical protein NtRootC45_41850 [Arthrobacter sp. NtRootC45]BCW33879.1 hypothetical protein NtRootD5_42100 [Arthrobacter sp. NtRootD5]
MTLGLVFIIVGLVWVVFRKWIASRQLFITDQMLNRPDEPDAGRVSGFEQLGVFFSILLIISGVVIVGLTLIFRPPWSGQ